MVEFVIKYFNDLNAKKNNEKYFRRENKIRNRKNVYCPKCYSTDIKEVVMGSNKIEMNCIKCGYKFKHCK